MSHGLYLLCVWLHLIAVSAWLGSMFFLAGVALPALRGDPASLGRFLQASSGRLRKLGWTCLALLTVTGFAQLGYRHLAWNETPLIQAKVAGFAFIVALSALHDFWVGPKASDIMAQNPGSPEALRWRKRAIFMARLTALLALLMVALGVMIVRGIP